MSSVRVRDKGAVNYRLRGADNLRFAALLTIVAFHVLLRSAQIEARAGLPASRLEDALIGAATLFDNRSLAILSLYLLLVHHKDRSFTQMLGERSRRLLVPYVAWTIAYALLDAILAIFTGRSKDLMSTIGDPGYWVRGLLFATTTPHLHFLPTLLFLTMLLPLMRIPVPITIGIALMCLAAVLRTFLEALLIPYGMPETASPALLVALMAGRILEYLPVSFLAARLALGSAITTRARILAGVGAVIAILGTMLFPVDLVAPITQGGIPLYWMLVQAVLGTLAVAFATMVLLATPTGIPSKNSIVLWFAPLAYGVFLVHPFVNEAFDFVIPFHAGPMMLLIRFVIVLVASTLTAHIISRNRRLARFV